MKEPNVASAAKLPDADAVSAEVEETENTEESNEETKEVVRVPFSTLKISADVLAGIEALGYELATDVQEEVIQTAVTGRDLLVQAKTGSGKTSAFGIPLVERIEANSGEPGEPRALVMVPTRELAHQVADEVRALGSVKGVSVLSVYGGVSIGRQADALNDGIDIVVGTPGRLLDHQRRGNLRFSKLQVLCLDEADEMLSMGFWDDVTAIMGQAPKDRQIMLFSATLPYDVVRAAKSFQDNPQKIDVSGDELSVDGIDNMVYHVVDTLPRPRQLLYLLETEQPTSAVVFCNTRNETEMVAKYLVQNGFFAEAISGSFRQKERERVMDRIKRKELRFMVATDIAARGIDIEHLSHVFNYSLPDFSEVYLHRVGRTGRAGRSGRAVSMVDGKGLATFTDLERKFKVKFQDTTLPEESEIMEKRAQRVVSELAERAADVELSAHKAMAEAMLADDKAPLVLAYLMKQFFNQEAKAAMRGQNQSEPSGEDSRRDGADDEGRGRRKRSGRSNSKSRSAESREARSERSSAPRSDDGEKRSGKSGGRKSRKSKYAHLETVDAADMLADMLGGAAPKSKDDGEKPEVKAKPKARGRAKAKSSSEGSTDDSAKKAEKKAAPKSRSTKTEKAKAPARPKIEEGLSCIRVNIGLNDGFKGRGAVAKKIAAMAGMNDDSLREVETKRDYSLLKAKPDIVEMVRDRVDGAAIGKKVLNLEVQD